MWFSVVWTLIDKYCLITVFKMLWTHSAQILTTVITNVAVDKITYNAKPHSICFFNTVSKSKKMPFSERDQDRGTRKEQALYITFLQSD